jgi:hypothetical protein
VSLRSRPVKGAMIMITKDVFEKKLEVIEGVLSHESQIAQQKK